MTERDEVGRPFWRGEGSGWMHMHVRECGLSTPIRVLFCCTSPLPPQPVQLARVPCSWNSAQLVGNCRKVLVQRDIKGGRRGGDEMLLAAGGGQAGVMEGMVWRWSISIRKKKKKPRFGSANELGELDRPSHSQDRISEVEVVFRGCKVEKEKREKKEVSVSLATGSQPTATVSQLTGVAARERARESQQRCWTGLEHGRRQGDGSTSLPETVLATLAGREEELLCVWAGA
ncbi:hypothetical protein GQ607_006193 [Colletotrichum asianum]|uniref:Uncharacterized protein n=1 Tax=Colletotrichum asianum TaxID=702518 RepID=A0A8H3ZWC4_9PEZI|nr:hypothetical protein GQ607_006193 [Colletotrichum asianum]